jgi:hypothetical protein
LTDFCDGEEAPVVEFLAAVFEQEGFAARVEVVEEFLELVFYFAALH